MKIENTKNEETATATALSQLAVACKHWRWMPGMAYVATNQTLSVADSLLLSIVDGDALCKWAINS